MTNKAGVPTWQLFELGLTTFEEAEILQKELIEKKKNKDYNRDYLILAEFKPVITKGRRFKAESLLRDESFVFDQGVSIKDVDRGGDVTYHGPGQLMVYPIAHLEHYGKDLRRWIHTLEEITLRVLADWTILGRREPGAPGIWVNDHKIASIGVGCTQWISYHGVGLNVSTDLQPFGWMIPCGLDGVQMTSMEQELGCLVPMQDVQKAWINQFEQVLGVSVR